MEKNMLRSAYSAEAFRNKGHQLIDLLADHLEKTQDREEDKVIRWTEPEAERDYWTEFLENGRDTDFFPSLLDRTIHIHHPNYMGHQISPAWPIGGLTGLLSAFLNNGMGIYEMGAAPTAMENIVTSQLCEALGYPKESRGFLTSGGTLANLTALLNARQKVQSRPEDKFSGKLGIMVSEEAHYCISRAAHIMGLKAEGLLRIPVGNDFAMRTELLESELEKAKAENIQVFAIVGSAPSTATGIYDDLEAIGSFARTHNIWFHVDAAHGGAAIFSPKYRHLLQGAALADSFVVDGHKMMMMPGITTALLFRDGQRSYQTFSQKADYLLSESEEEDWYNLAKRTFECTKHMMSLHWYAMWKAYGDKLYDEFLTTLYDLGREFADLINKDPLFELAVSPMANIVCFRYAHPEDSQAEQDAINTAIRQGILDEGEFYIVQTKLLGKVFLRTSLMNPFTTKTHLQALMDQLKELAAAQRE